MPPVGMSRGSRATAVSNDEREGSPPLAASGIRPGGMADHRDPNRVQDRAFWRNDDDFPDNDSGPDLAVSSPGIPGPRDRLTVPPDPSKSITGWRTWQRIDLA